MKVQPVLRRTGGLTLIEVIVVLALILLLAATFLPALSDRPRKATRITCVINLKEIYLGCRIWEADHTNFPTGISITNGGAMEFAEKGIAYRVFQVASNELSTPKIFFCPTDSARSAATNFSVGFDNSHISYFVGMVTNDSNPNAIFAGDDNLTINGIRVRTGIVTLWTNNLVGWTKERHDGRGNIGLADGSIQQASVNGLHSAISAVEVPTRVVIP